MRTELFWVPGPWRGRLAITPRPRAGNWLEDEIRTWRKAGVDVVVSLLTPDEAADLDLTNEETISRREGTDFVSFPIADRGIPSSQQTMTALLTSLLKQLAEGKNVAVHCRQGIGRAAVVGIGLLATAGLSLDEAIQRVGDARGCPVPETPGQRQWLEQYVKTHAIKPAKQGVVYVGQPCSEDDKAGHRQ